MNFDIVVKTIPVTITGPDGSKSHELREMCASDREKYLDSVSRRMETSADGKSRHIKKFDGFHADLLGSCLYTAEGKLVSKETIQSWPCGTVSILFAEAQKLNQLGDDTEGLDAAKKE